MRKRYLVAVGMVSLALSSQAFAQAPGFALNQIRSLGSRQRLVHGRIDGLSWPSSTSSGHRWRLGTQAARRLWEGRHRARLPGERSILRVRGRSARGVDRVRFALNVPVALYQAGDDAIAAGTSFTAPSSRKLGRHSPGRRCAGGRQISRPLQLWGRVAVVLADWRSRRIHRRRQAANHTEAARRGRDRQVRIRRQGWLRLPSSERFFCRLADGQ